jgi:hypothetical protein
VLESLTFPLFSFVSAACIVATAVLDSCGQQWRLALSQLTTQLLVAQTENCSVKLFSLRDRQMLCFSYTRSSPHIGRKAGPVPDDSDCLVQVGVIWEFTPLDTSDNQCQEGVLGCCCSSM